MQIRKNQLEGLSVREFILDERPLSAAVPLSGSTQLILFASFFGALIKGIKEIVSKIIFPIGTILSIIPEIIKLINFKKSNNKNAKSWLDIIVGIGGLFLEVTAVTLMVTGLIATLAWLAPLLFVVNVGIKFLYSLSTSAYYLFQVGKNLFNNSSYTQKHASDKKKLIQSLKETALSGGLLIAILFLFFIPAAFPAVILTAGIVLGVKIGVAILLGLFGLHIIGTAIKETSRPTEKINVVTRVHENSSLKEKYQDPRNFLTLQSHVDDLLIKLEFIEEKNSSSNTKKDFLQRLILEEESHLQNKQGLRFQLKREALGQLKLLVEAKSEFSSVEKLISYYKTQHQIKDILRSYGEYTGRMQKLFVLVDAYLKKLSSPVPEALPPISPFLPSEVQETPQQLQQLSGNPTSATPEVPGTPEEDVDVDGVGPSSNQQIPEVKETSFVVGLPLAEEFTKAKKLDNVLEKTLVPEINNHFENGKHPNFFKHRPQPKCNSEVAESNIHFTLKGG